MRLHYRAIVPATVAALLIGFAPLRAQSGLVVEQKSTINIARISNGDLKQKVMIHGADRQKIVTEGKMKFLVFSQDASGTEIVRLDQEQVYQLNDKKKQYTALSIEDMRAQMAKRQSDAEKASPDAREAEDVRYSVVSDGIQRTGEKKTINGFSTEQMIIKLTVMAENTKTGEKAPAFYMTADAWVDPSQKEAAKAGYTFAKAYADALGLDPRTAGNPYGKWVQSMYENLSGIEGYAIQTNLVMELAAEPQQGGEAENSDRSVAAPADAVGAAIGGLMKRARKPKAEAAPNPAASGRPVLFSMVTEVTSISTAAPAESEFELPAGYRKS